MTVSAGCSYFPAAQEKQQVEDTLRSVPDVMMANVTCESTVFASDRLCVEVVTKFEDHIRFERVGFGSLGSSAMNVVVSRVNHLSPRVATCSGVGPPNFHRSSALGHRFHPSLLDLKDAAARFREIIKDVDYWPECPQFWETQDVFGSHYRYCQRKDGATDEPPKPDNCAP
jgi:hypothetical protein